MKISKITFHAGESQGSTPLEIKPATVVILVGPNNSGKSLALREIENWCLGQNADRKVIQDVAVDFPDNPEEAKNLLHVFETNPPPNQVTMLGHFWIGQHSFYEHQSARHFQVRDETIKNAVVMKDTQTLRSLLSAYYTVRLDGRTRFSLVDPRPTGDLQSLPQNHLWALFVNDQVRKRVRKFTQDAFNLHFVVDPTEMQRFRVRMSEKEPASKAEEQALDESARKFHAAAQLIEDLGDGVKTFTGLVAAILSLPHTIILVDEPEAFLHPPLARRLGQNLANIAKERNASLVVATHSSEFLIGCMESVNDVSVVRLTYERPIATARTLAPDELTLMMRDPLMRSTDILRALFSRAAIVTEGDADRAFYDEMNRRLQSEGRGIKDALFLNAQNVQTLHKIVGPLRKIGIPAVAIADIDLLKDTNGCWENVLDACQIDKTQWSRLDTERKTITLKVDNTTLKKSGINALGSPEKEKAEALLNELGKFGLFLVPVGELEGWLKKLGVIGHTPKWLIELFARIGSSESEPNYLKPDVDDVWLFLDNIEKWIRSV